MRAGVAVGLLAGVLAAGLVLAGCSDDPEPAAQAPAPPRATARPVDAEPPAAAPEEVAAEVERLAEEWFDVSRGIRGDRFLLDEADRYLTGAYRDAYGSEYRRFTLAPEAIRLSARSSVAVEDVEVREDHALVTTCEVDADLLLVRGTWRILSTTVTARRHQYQARPTPEGWRLAEHAVLAEARGEACPDPA